MNKSNDKFADLFSMANNGKVNTAKLSLIERQKLTQNNSNEKSVRQNNQSAVTANNWDGLDLLGAAGSNGSNVRSQSNSNTSTPLNHSSSGFPSLEQLSTTEPQPNNKHLQLDVIFDIFNKTSDAGNVPSTTKKSMITEEPNPATYRSANDDFLLDDDFTDAFEPVVQARQPSSSLSSASFVSENSKSVKPPSRSHSSFASDSTPDLPAQSNNTRQKQSKRDEIIAELVDIGFPIEKANEAVKMVGLDVQKAVNFIMNESLGREGKKELTRQPSNISHHQNEDRLNQDDFGQMVNDLSSEFMSKASFLFNKGRQTLVKGIEMYKEQNMQANDNVPIWMRNQERYKSENTIPLEGDDDNEEVDPAEIKRIIAQQRSREKERQRERLVQTRSHSPQLKSQSNNTSIEVSSDHNRPRMSNTIGVGTPETRVRTQLPESEKKKLQDNHVKTEDPIVDIFSPIPSRSQMFRAQKKEEELYVSSSRRRTTPRSSKSSVSSNNISKSSTPKLTRPFVPINEFQQSDFDKFKNSGNDLFKKGDFTDALTNYQKALTSLPVNHDLNVLAYSNLSQCHLKLGDAKSALEESNKGLALLADFKNYDNWTISNKPIIEFWTKLLYRKAEALEHLERFKEALGAYTELIENGATTKNIMDGKNRCQKVLNPKPTSPPSLPPKSNPTAPVSRPPKINSDNSEVLNRVKKSSADQEKFEKEKFLMHDDIEARVNAWKLGKEDNLRALLASLDQILMPGTNWKTVNISELMLPKKVKMIYMKAVSKTHPDKIPKDASTEYKLIAQSIFVVLNQSWDKFKDLNGLQ